MIFLILLIICGFVLLIYGANWLVNGASALAKRYHITDLTIGLTIVAFGTSAPELVVNGIASADGLSDMVYANIIGSNIFNLFVILGIVGVIIPITVKASMIWKEIPISLLAVIGVLLLSNGFYVAKDSQLTRVDGLVLLLGFASFLWYVFTQLNTTDTSHGASSIEIKSNRIGLYIIVGLIAMIIGGKLVVDNAVLIATTLGLSKKLIGLTIVAAGTSLPELVTSGVAAWKKNSDIAIGNVIGSNIFNLLLILPLSAMISPVEYNPLFDRDLMLLIGGTCCLFAAMFVSGKKKLDRWEAALLLVTYLVYIGWQIWSEN